MMKTQRNRGQKKKDPLLPSASLGRECFSPAEQSPSAEDNLEYKCGKFIITA